MQSTLFARSERHGEKMRSVLFFFIISVVIFTACSRSSYYHARYNELRLTVDRLNNLLAADYIYPALQNASAWYIDMAGNRVVVELTDYSCEAIHLFNTTVMYSPVIQFERVSTRFEINIDNFDDETILDINIDNIE